MVYLTVLLSLTFATLTAAQSNSVVCVAGQCLQGTVNTSLGGTLSIPSNPSILLLPGQYTSSSQPQLLHDALLSGRASLSLSSGFSNQSSSSALSLPLTIAPQPGIISYPQSLFRGQATFIEPRSSANKTPATIPLGSFLVAPNTWAALISSNTRMVVWDAIPDFTQIPSTSGSTSLSLIDIQSASCSPPCASTGTCNPSGQCVCAPGFTGQSCESCAPGFFGSSCQPCPSNCSKCDQGLTGTGKCLVPSVANPPSSCNCLNGLCGSNGQCTCNPGWTNGSNGTACASCTSGFFLTPGGDCSVCQLGCTHCSDGTGDCTSCKSGFTLDSTDRTKCNATTSTPATTNGSGQPCPDGGFDNGGTCTLCASTCKTCTGPTSNDCVGCGTGQSLLNGACVGTDANGICSGTKLIANNIKHVCDACPAKCTACKIPNFNVLSVISQAQCTACLPGFVLSQGKCVQSCPSGTFLASDNLTCTPCDSSCASCIGDSKFCVTCNANGLAINGTCATSCPTNTFSVGGACLACHPDCATCSGGGFNQCATCPSSRPVLSSGRCLPTCSRSEFFDTTSSSCRPCDASCASCVGGSPNSCLSCAKPGQVLRSGSCQSSSCTSSSSVVPGLGVCLSDLVAVPNPSSTAPPSLPTFVPPPTSSPRHLAWWEILLMALGCAFTFVIVLWIWRWRARKRRAKQTAIFATKLKQRPMWRRRFGRFADLFKGANRPKQSTGLFFKETDNQRLQRLRDAEKARHAHEMSKLESAYAKSGSRAASPQRSIDDGRSHITGFTNRASGPSLYSYLTGVPRRTPEPRQPAKDLDLERGNEHLLTSRFSTTTSGTSIYYQKADGHGQPEMLPPMPTEAEAYATMHRSTSEQLIPIDAGSSRNPFRR